jgi:hypothetical protein
MFHYEIFLALDALFMALMSCISAHLNVLGGAFKTLHPRCVERITRCKLNSKNLELEVDKEMIKCIQHLQTLLRFAFHVVLTMLLKINSILEFQNNWNLFTMSKLSFKHVSH